MTNQELIEAYMNSIMLLSKKSIENRASFLKVFSKDFQKSFLEITTADLRTYIIQKKESGEWNKAGTILQKIILLKIFFKFLTNEGYLNKESDPAKLLKAPKQHMDSEVRTWNAQEIRALIKAAESSMIEAKQKLLFYLAITSGSRANEICMIKKANIDLQKCLIFIPSEDTKGQYREKLVPISNRTKELIELYYIKYQNNTEYLFVNRFGRHIAPRAVYQATKDVIDVAYPYKGSWKKPFGPHSARHTFASRWIESGGDWHALRAIMGWRSFQQFDRYVSVSPEYISKAAAKVQKKLLKV